MGTVVSGKTSLNIFPVGLIDSQFICRLFTNDICCLTFILMMMREKRLQLWAEYERKI
jgi:hypothetical protein